MSARVRNVRLGQLVSMRHSLRNPSRHTGRRDVPVIAFIHGNKQASLGNTSKLSSFQIALQGSNRAKLTVIIFSTEGSGKSLDSNRRGSTT
jgi:hypothetical protein